MYSGKIKYKEYAFLVTFKVKPSMQTVLFDKNPGYWLPLEISFKKKNEKNIFINSSPSSIFLILDNSNYYWNINSIKQFSYSDKSKSVILHFNSCFQTKELL